MNRIDDARKGYLQGNFHITKSAHTPSSIYKAIIGNNENTSSFNLPDIILGGQDGIVNVLGIILGMAVATSDSHMVILAGLAATFVESISMAAVAYTSKLAQADYYQSEYEREKWEIDKYPGGERQEIKILYESYGFKGKVLDEIIDKLTADKSIWLKVMMEQELKLTPVKRKEALPMAIVVGISALIGSFIPLLPFFIFSISLSMWLSLCVSSLTLFIVGYYKGQKTVGRDFLKHGLEMMLIGILSALAGYTVGYFLKS